MQKELLYPQQKKNAIKHRNNIANCLHLYKSEINEDEQYKTYKEFGINGIIACIVTNFNCQWNNDENIETVPSLTIINCEPGHKFKSNTSFISSPYHSRNDRFVVDQI